MSPLACQRQLRVDSGSFRESILARCPDPGEGAAGLMALSPAVSPGPPCQAPVPPAAMSQALMAPTSPCQCWRHAAKHLAAGHSSGTVSSAACCDEQFGTRPPSPHVGTPAMLCPEGWARGGQKTSGAGQEVALCSHLGQLEQLQPLGAPSPSPTKPQPTRPTPLP